jgi:hypothetical protein
MATQYTPELAVPFWQQNDRSWYVQFEAAMRQISASDARRGWQGSVPAVGNLRPAFRTITASGAVLPTDGVILVDATAGAVTVTLQSAGIGVGEVVIKKKDSSGNAVTIAPPSGTIDGAASVALTAQNKAIRVACDGANYWVVGAY